MVLARNAGRGIQRYAFRQMVMGWEHYQGVEREKDADKALLHTRRAARLRNRSAQNNLGMFYAIGIGVEQDLDQALRWFQRAEKGARTGNAQYNLGYMHYHGEGVPQDDEQARLFFEKSAERDFPLSHWYLGEIHRLGRGVEIDPEKAFQHYWQAAMLGHGPGFRSAGWSYWTGEGVEPNPVKAYALTLIAVAYFGDGVHTQLAKMHPQITPEQIGEAEILSTQLYEEYAVMDFADLHGDR
ncbi:MAG: sel1 repeat family protein [Verrucomicrobia bacterium]|nr:sel1 repeat family protein [Verrucomicrobiota bacterium]MCH8514662.1 sel1 repeat family protein [Kiritimatiellia bacterium]